MKSFVGTKIQVVYRKLIAKPVILIAILFGIVGSTLLAFSLANPNPSPTHKRNDKPLDARDQAKQHSNKVLGKLSQQTLQLQLAGLDLKNNPGKKSTLAPKLKKIAEDRKKDLLQLMVSDPRAARQVLLGKNASKTLLQNGIGVEQRVVLTGVFGFKNWRDATGVHRLNGSLTTKDNRTYLIHDDKMLSTIKYGATIRISGHSLDDQLLVDARPYSAESQITTTAYVEGTTITTEDPITLLSTTSISPTTGPILDAVMFANFGGTSGTVNIEKLKAIYNGSPGKDLVSYVSENSYGKANLVPEYYSLGDFSNIPCNDINAQINAMKSALAGQTTKQYQIYTYLTNCPYNGFASRSGNNPAVIYLSSADTFYAHAHELSHTLGTFLSHGGYIDCGLETFIPPTNNTFESVDCVGQEYNDRYDILGNGSSAHLSASHKLNASWLDTAQIATADSIGTSAYTLAPYEKPNSLIALKIPRGNSGSYFTVEYRQPIGFDTDIDCARCIPAGNATQGALIRLAGYSYWGPGGGADSNLIDTTPESVEPESGWWPADDGIDSTLLPGKIFTDSEYGISIKTISADANGLKVEVTNAAACSRAPMTVSAPAPSIQTAQPGVAKNFSLTVTNNDSAGCKPNDYRFRPTDFGLYGGLDYTLPANADSIKISSSPAYWSLAPGQTKTLTLTMQSKPNTLAGSYGGTNYQTYVELGAVLSSSYGSQPMPVTGARLVIPSSNDAVPPSQPSNLSSSVLGSSTATLHWLPSNDNTRVAMYKITLNGGSSIVTYQPSTLLTGLLPGTTYTYTIQAIDTNANYSAATNGSFTTPMKSDTIAPTAVGKVLALASDESIAFSWGQAHDAGGIKYYTYMNGYCGPTVFASRAVADCVLPNIFYKSPNPIRIYGYDGDGNTASYYESEVTDIKTTPPGVAQAPSKPQGLYVSSVTHATGNTLKWQASSDDMSVAGYNIYRGASKIAFATGTTYQDNSAKNGGVYRVQAVDNQGAVSQFSEQYSATGSTSSAQTDVQAPTAALSSHGNNSVVSGTITLTTNASDNTAISKVRYTLDGKYIGEVSAAPYKLTIDTAKYGDGQHEIVATALDVNSALVCCRSNAGTSGVSVLNFSNNQVDSNTPTVPENLISTASSANQVNLSWAESVDNVRVVQYAVLRDGIKIDTVIGTAYTDLNVLPNDTYAYQVIAYDMAGNASLPSTTSTVTTPNVSDSTMPSQPINLIATAVSTSQINLSWSPSSDNIGVTGYDIYRNGSKIVTSATASFGDTGLNANTEYSYYIVARDGAGNSSLASNTVTARTQSVSPPPPTQNVTTLQGIVSDRNGAGLSSATVTININGANRTYTTNTAGFYSITGIPAGTYNRVKYAKKGYTSQSLTIVVQEGQIVNQNVILTKNGK